MLEATSSARGVTKLSETWEREGYDFASCPYCASRMWIVV